MSNDSLSLSYYNPQVTIIQIISDILISDNSMTILMTQYLLLVFKVFIIVKHQVMICPKNKVGCNLTHSAAKLYQTIDVHCIMDIGLFGKSDARLIGNYKTFIENTVIDLGEDWRVQSFLLSEQITNYFNANSQQKMVNEHEQNGTINVFNQFLLPFLKGKIDHQKQIVSAPESTIQQNFTQQILKGFGKNQKIFTSLTFSTLSLGFCITAIEIWRQQFKDTPQTLLKNVKLIPLGSYTIKSKVQSQQKHFQDQSVRTLTAGLNQDKVDFNSCQMSSSKQGQQMPSQPIFLGKNNEQIKWCANEDLCFLSKKEYKNIMHTLQKANSSKQIIFDKFVCSFFQFSLDKKKVRVVSLKNQFYRTAIIVWLAFSIKLFFQLRFTQYLVYFKAICKQWNDKMEAPLVFFFKIVEIEWNLLLKDISVALKDDLQVLNKLIDRIEIKITKLWLQKSKALQTVISAFH